MQLTTKWPWTLTTAFNLLLQGQLDTTIAMLEAMETQIMTTDRILINQTIPVTIIKGCQCLRNLPQQWDSSSQTSNSSTCTKMGMGMEMAMGINNNSTTGKMNTNLSSYFSHLRCTNSNNNISNSSSTNHRISSLAHCRRTRANLRQEWVSVWMLQCSTANVKVTTNCSCSPLTNSNEALNHLLAQEKRVIQIASVKPLF